MEKMSNVERARQFMPFAALRGFEEMIQRQTREVTPRRVLSEEEAMRLSKTLSRLEKGSVVRVTYYEEDSYLTLDGMISELDLTLRFLRIVKKRIELDDIFDISIVE